CAQLERHRLARPRAPDLRHGGSRSAGSRRNLRGAASMNAVARLVLTYAFGTRVLRSFSVAGFTVLIAGTVLLGFLAQSEWLLVIPFFGAALLFLGSALMPLMFGRMARSHLIRVLPWGRVKLLLSAFITVALVALPLPLISLFATHLAMD